MLSLAELARLREGGRVPARFGVAPLPGSRQYADADGKLVPADANYVPYFAGGRFGVVRKTCPKPEAAFDLLADLGGPARSAELVSTPGLGAGPFRNAHLDLPLLWYGYGFDEPASKALVAAMQKFVRPEVKNPVFGLRGPDQARLTAALGGEATAVAAGAAKPEDALKRADEAWEKIGAETPGVLQQRRRAVGLQ
ncbi:MAG: hypothetical protein K2P78_12405 [Gemmataceae bacterium]|nr:hypothetical protein [Gemmataceae bacterium]